MTISPLNIRVRNLLLKYPKKTVLKGLDADFKSGKINMILGENGAGKSSLIKILCGDLLPNSGSFLINGKDAKIRQPSDAIREGIVCVHQRPILSDSITVIENLSLGVKDFDKEEAEKILSQWKSGITGKTLAKNCGGDERFFISLSGALLKKPSVLILDEPSALLNPAQRRMLFSKLRDFADDGMNVIVITHYLDEAKQFGDEIFFIEDGRVCFTVKNKDDNFSEIEKKFNHTKLQAAASITKKESPLKLTFSDITSLPKEKPAIRDFSFSASGGEVTLIYGQTEDGRETLEDFICGMGCEKQSGRLEISDSALENPRHFSFSIKNGNFTRRKLEKSPFTFGIIPSNKTFRASNPELTILQLLTAGAKVQKDKDEKFRALSIIKNADVNISPYDKAGYLSGGMLQRLILEREIAKNPDILILCEPVQGLDSERTEKVFKSIRDFADKGKIVIVLASSDFPRKICDSIYTLEKSL